MLPCVEPRPTRQDVCHPGPCPNSSDSDSQTMPCAPQREAQPRRGSETPRHPSLNRAGFRCYQPHPCFQQSMSSSRSSSESEVNRTKVGAERTKVGILVKARVLRQGGEGGRQRLFALSTGEGGRAPLKSVTTPTLYLMAQFGFLTRGCWWVCSGKGEGGLFKSAHR